MADKGTVSASGTTVSANGGMLPVGCVIMASGLGRRFGGNKLMADFQGQTLIQKILSATAEPLFSHRVVVTRHPEIAALCRSQGIETILHELPGRNDTIRLGLEYLLRLQPDLQGCCFCPADQPLLSRETLVHLLEAFSQNPDKILRPGARSPWAQKPFFCGEVPADRGLQPDTKFQPRSELQTGSPVFFPRSLFPELCCLPAGKGGSALIRNYPELIRLLPVSDPKELLDVDTPEDLRRLADISKLNPN